jgi:GntR family transcriptional regulator
MVLDKHNPVPLYFQLKNIIEEKIYSGELKPGDKIPSENSLCEQYKISRTTARQAISELVNTGKVMRTQGRGTFVAQSLINKQPYRLSGFTADMKNQGLHPGSKVLEMKVIMPTPEISNMLRISPSEAVIFIKRLRNVDGTVMGVESTYLPFTRFPKLMDEVIENASLYEILINKFNTVPTRISISFESLNCKDDLCELLKIPKSSPLLHIFGISYDQNDRLIEYASTYYRGDLYTFLVEINKLQNENLLVVRREFKSNPDQLLQENN